MRVELRAVRAGEAADVARELDRRDLHAEAEAEEGHAVFAGELRGANFPFDAAVAEAAGDEDAGDIVRGICAGSLRLEFLRIDEHEIGRRNPRSRRRGSSDS